MLYCSNTSVRPPRVLTRSFPSCPHHLYYAGFRAVIGLRLVWQPYPPALAYKWFLCVGAKVCLHLPSALLNLAARTLVFSYILPTAGWIRDLHSLERAPAGRTKNARVAWSHTDVWNDIIVLVLIYFIYITGITRRRGKFFLTGAYVLKNGRIWYTLRISIFQ